MFSGMIPFTSTGACRSDSGPAENFHSHRGCPGVVLSTQWDDRGDHYLDEFITTGPPDSEECHYNRSSMLKICCRLGVSLADEKLEGPSACLTFLGIEIDTMAGALQLPRAKLTRIRHTLHRWRGQRTC